jgi:AcrR family transcriptional regulator
VNEHSFREQDMNAPALTPLAPIRPKELPDRGAEILARIRQAFAEKGFDGASMQDLARAAGMSVGNFYRYFPSKDAIIEAMVGYDMAEIERDFAAIHVASDPRAALRAKIAEHLTDDCRGEGRLWAEITAAAHRKAEIARICCAMEDVVANNLVVVFARITGLDVDTCRARFGAQARFLVMMVKAAATRTPTPHDAALGVLIMRSIDETLTEIETLAGKD